MAKSHQIIVYLANRFKKAKWFNIGYGGILSRAPCKRVLPQSPFFKRSPCRVKIEKKFKCSFE